MKPITLFVTSWCPYCKKALSLIDELKQENNAYVSLEIHIIDEEKQPDIADKHDYYYVPTFYIGEEKLHEGPVEREHLEHIFNKALNG